MEALPPWSTVSWALGYLSPKASSTGPWGWQHTYVGEPRGQRPLLAQGQGRAAACRQHLLPQGQQVLRLGDFPALQLLGGPVPKGHPVGVLSLGQGAGEAGQGVQQQVRLQAAAV